MKKLISLFFILLYIPVVYGQLGYTEKGIASYYHKKFHGRKTASGEKFDFNSLTAAHKKLPFQTMVKVTNLTNNKSVIVRINDRGPFTKGRIIDLSGKAAKEIGLITNGVAKVKIEVIGENGKVEEIKETTTNTITTEQTESNKIISPAELKKLMHGNYYDINGNLIKPSGYGIQINSYIEPENVVKEYSLLQSKIAEDLTIEVINSKRKRIYRVIIGRYPTESAAKKALTTLRKKGIKGIIKKY